MRVHHGGKKLGPHPVYVQINTVTSLNGEKHPGHTGEEEEEEEEVERVVLDEAGRREVGDNVCEWRVF